eukprot:597797-Pleurochrysis_carterae.AAC.1
MIAFTFAVLDTMHVEAANLPRQVWINAPECALPRLHLCQILPPNVTDFATERISRLRLRF